MGIDRIKGDIVFGTIIENKDLWESPSAHVMPLHRNIDREGVNKADVNRNGEITAADAILVLRIAAEKLIPKKYQAYATDINWDRQINSVERSYIILKVLYTLSKAERFLSK